MIEEPSLWCALIKAILYTSSGTGGSVQAPSQLLRPKSLGDGLGCRTTMALRVKGMANWGGEAVQPSHFAQL